MTDGTADASPAAAEVSAAQQAGEATQSTAAEGAAQNTVVKQDDAAAPPVPAAEAAAPDTSTAAAAAGSSLETSQAAAVPDTSAAAASSIAETAQADALPGIEAAASGLASDADAAAASAAANPSVVPGANGQPLSKNQQKKLAKAAKRQEFKAQRRAEEKEKKKAAQEAKRAEGREKFEALSPEERAAHKKEAAERLDARRQAETDRRARLQQALRSGQRVVIDLDFAGLMTQAEVNSICHQLQHCYSANGRAAAPCHLHLTSVQAAIKEQMDRQLAGYQNWSVTRSAGCYTEQFANEKERLVYLTADAEDELADLDPADIYIIGGLVDRNRHKGVCYDRATEQGIRTAKLPIAGNVQLTSSTVLTVNQVMEIMLEYLDKREWAAALEKVIPQRKRAGGGGGSNNAETGSDAKRAKVA